MEVIENPLNADTQLPIAGAYQKKWLLTYNEKDAFKKIKAVSDEIGCYTFSKVRLLDLLEPVKGNAKYKTYFYKVQAKHVDFVILNEKLVARCIIELDDASHDTEERTRRDEFVDEVLKSVDPYPRRNRRGTAADTRDHENLISIPVGGVNIIQYLHRSVVEYNLVVFLVLFLFFLCPVSSGRVGSSGCAMMTPPYGQNFRKRSQSPLGGRL